MKAAITDHFPEHPAPLAVNKLEFKDSDKLPFSHFLIQFPPGTRTKEITDTKYFLNQPVWWKRYRKKQAFQCFNCQRIGHPSGECNMGYRCVKCNEKHGPKQCKRTLDEQNSDQAFCVNYGKHGHPANYRGCPYMKYAQEIVNERKREERQAALAKTNGQRATRKQGVSYAMASSYQRDAQSSPTPTYSQNRFKPPHNFSMQEQPLNYSSMRELLTGFRTEICDKIDARTNALQNQINDQNIKIKNLYRALNLSWP